MRSMPAKASTTAITCKPCKPVTLVDIGASNDQIKAKTVCSIITRSSSN